MEKNKLILLICFMSFLSCSTAGDLQSSKDKDDKTKLINDTDNAIDVSIDESGWFARFKLKPQADASYMATKDPEIKALVLKYGVTIAQSWLWPTSDPELLLYYDLTGQNSMSKKSRDNCINDLLSTGKFEDEFACTNCTNELDWWAVKLKLQPQADESYIATKDPEIMALVLKHGITMRQTMPPGPRSTPELLSYYTLTGSVNMSKESKEKCINDFLSTGKFEDEVYEYEIVYSH